MSADTRIRAALRQTADTVEVPTLDRTGFDRRVRRFRNRRRAKLAAVGALAMVIAVAVPLAVFGGGGGGRDSTQLEPVVRGNVELRKPVYFFVTRGGSGHAMAVDPDENVHDLHARVEEILGRTYDGVIMLGTDSSLVRIRASNEGGEWRFERIPAPVTGTIGNARPSDDGSLLFARTLRGEPAIYDLATNQIVARPELRPFPIGVDDFDGSQVLYVTVHATWLGTGDGDPIRFPKSFSSTAVGGDVVAIPDDDDLVVRLYDTSGGSARQIGQVAGDHGDLSPDGRYYLALPAERGQPMLWQRGAAEPEPMAGLGCCASDIRWLDDHTAVILFRSDQGSRLLACAVPAGVCDRIYASPDVVWLRY